MLKVVLTAEAIRGEAKNPADRKTEPPCGAYARLRRACSILRSASRLAIASRLS